jgi:hypothetical protein
MSRALKRLAGQKAIFYQNIGQKAIIIRMPILILQNIYAN